VGAKLVSKRYSFSIEAYTLRQMQSPALFHGEISGCRNTNKNDSEPWPYARRVFCTRCSRPLTTFLERNRACVAQARSITVFSVPTNCCLSQQLGTAKRGLLLSFAKEQLHPYPYTQHCNTSPISSISPPSSLHAVIKIIRCFLYSKGILLI
jgi:hypothetical protein